MTHGCGCSRQDAIVLLLLLASLAGTSEADTDRHNPQHRPQVQGSTDRTDNSGGSDGTAAHAHAHASHARNSSSADADMQKQSNGCGSWSFPPGALATFLLTCVGSLSLARTAVTWV